MQKQEQQTAVEWFYEEMIKFIKLRSKYSTDREIFKQAKEMEKARMIEFGELCWKNLLRSDVIMRPRDVYNETYGGKK
jgi:hypothetical protein